MNRPGRFGVWLLSAILLILAAVPVYADEAKDRKELAGSFWILPDLFDVLTIFEVKSDGSVVAGHGGVFGMEKEVRWVGAYRNKQLVLRNKNWVGEESLHSETIVAQVSGSKMTGNYNLVVPALRTNDKDTFTGYCVNCLFAPIIGGIVTLGGILVGGRILLRRRRPKKIGPELPDQEKSGDDDHSDEDDRCDKLKEEFQKQLSEYRRYDDTIGEIESTWKAYQDVSALIKVAEQAVHETDVWMRLYNTFGYVPQRMYDGLRYLVDKLTNAGDFLSPALAFGGTLSAAKMAPLLARLGLLSEAGVTALSGVFSVSSFGVATVAYAGTSNLRNHAANIAAHAAAVRNALPKAYEELDRLEKALQELRSNYGSAPLSIVDQQIRHEEVNALKLQLKTTCPNTVVTDDYVPFVRGLRPDWVGNAN